MGKDWIDYRIEEMEHKVVFKHTYDLEDAYHYSISDRLKRLIHKLTMEYFYKEVALPNERKVRSKNKRT